MTDISERVLDLRQLYWANGYRPVPIVNSLKRPIQKCWPELARQNPPDACVTMPQPGVHGTGVLCDGHRPIDLDCDNVAIANDIAKQAKMMFGDGPTRYRDNSPRILIMYRATDNESPSKASVKNRATGEGVEVLGHGNQFFADGWHPSGVPLLWRNGGPHLTHFNDLNTISPAQLVAFIDWCAERLGADSINYGNHLPKVSSAPANRCQQSVSPMTFGHAIPNWPLEDIVSALDSIPNPATDWNFMFKIAAATFDASGGSLDGFKAFCDWSRECPTHSETLAIVTWQNLLANPAAHITAGTLDHFAHRNDAFWQRPSKTLCQLSIFNK